MLGTTVLGGMLAATIIAIFIVPTTFYVSQRLFSRPGSARGLAAEAEGPAVGSG